MQRLVWILLFSLSACAPLCSGELERLANRDSHDTLTQVPDRQDFRTPRQKLPSCVLF
ncbi:hypothetical protein [Desulfolutivibrio sulfoxidireducens]|uniref:hypothetical protein n=1 Tax=Desulfolutivibrio sulfoxidireducens TaxID=2773299 RepID=UPI00159D1376|nr:hypothetical protein [Desulfolutivibrio sulfoxidireducens]